MWGGLNAAEAAENWRKVFFTYTRGLGAESLWAWLEWWVGQYHRVNSHYNRGLL